MKQKVLIDQAADRGVYVCQSQSLNLFLQSPKFAQVSSMHFYSWKKGLKTGIYYLRTKAAKSQQFTIDPKLLEKIKKQKKTTTEDTHKFSGNKQKYVSFVALKNNKNKKQIYTTIYTYFIFLFLINFYNNK